MKYLDLSFADPEANLACDEALLELFEVERPNDGILRVWEPTSYFVVLGHSNRLRAEVDQTTCAEKNIPILRRISGGGTVMQGPGCLNYSLVLDIHAHGLRNIRDAFRYVLQRHCLFIDTILDTKTSIEGISDLTVLGRKFSGNAQYRKSRFVLVHGTFLLHLDLTLMDRHLKMPPKQPDYRRNRPHLAFLANLNLDPGQVRESLRAAWSAAEEFFPVPFRRIQALVRERYTKEEWSAKF